MYCGWTFHKPTKYAYLKTSGQVEVQQQSKHEIKDL